MALFRDASVASIHPPGLALSRLASPIATFIVLSLIFGISSLVINPPLRGPDEAAHFLRILAISNGDIAPSVSDAEGRKGTFIPAGLHDDFEFFESARYKLGTPGFSYVNIFNEFRRRRGSAETDTRPPVFVVYQGSEAYSPAPYLPYFVAVAVGRGLGLDFLGLFYLMRIAGLVTFTAAVAYAISIVPHLRWPFALIAMLPSALYGRTVLSADGAALSLTLIAMALFLRSACNLRERGLWERACFMSLCGLAKPPQLAFLVLEFMSRPLRDLPRRARAIALVVLPPLILSALWVAATGMDAGTWRAMKVPDPPSEMFDPRHKLGLLLADPLHFVALVSASLGRLDELWRELIGVLGWLDTRLRDWIYPVLAGFLVASLFGSLPLPRATRYRIAAASMLTVVGYVVAVYLIFYLAWTPANALSIDGVQGRYFVVVLAPIASAIAAAVNWGPGETSTAAIATGGAVLSGAATVEALLRTNW